MRLSSIIEAKPRQAVARFLTSDDKKTNLAVLVVGASLALAIAVIHLQDQGGLPGHQSPVWLKYGFYMIEISSTVSAALIIRGKTAGWLLGLASSIGPMTGYLLSRTVGLPGDSGDVGNWGYVLGTVSLIAEGGFVVLAVVCLTRMVTGWQPDEYLAGRASRARGDRRSLDTSYG